MNEMTRWRRPSFDWPVFGRLTNLRDELDRLFDSPVSEWGRGSQLFSGWTPAIDLHEDKDHVYVKAELPGMKKEEIDVSLHEGCLSISGERKTESNSEQSEVHRTERFVGRFQRTVTLPSPVIAEKARAEYKDGVLSITLPKAEEAKPRQIDVKVG